MSESHDGSSGYDTASCWNRGDRGDGLDEWIDYVLFPFVLIDEQKQEIGTAGVIFKTADDCVAAGDRWMSLDRETQLEMLTKHDYTKFV